MYSFLRSVRNVKMRLLLVYAFLADILYQLASGLVFIVATIEYLSESVCVYVRVCVFPCFRVFA